MNIDIQFSLLVGNTQDSHEKLLLSVQFWVIYISPQIWTNFAKLPDMNSSGKSFTLQHLEALSMSETVSLFKWQQPKHL